VALLQAADVYAQTYESHFRYPTAERLRALPAPTLFAAPPWDPKHPHTEAAARVAGGPFRELPADASGWGRAVLEALAQRGKE
jgi:hypothetical protein